MQMTEERRWLTFQEDEWVGGLRVGAREGMSVKLFGTLCQ